MPLNNSIFLMFHCRKIVAYCVFTKWRCRLKLHFFNRWCGDTVQFSPAGTEEQKATRGVWVELIIEVRILFHDKFIRVSLSFGCRICRLLFCPVSCLCLTFPTECEWATCSICCIAAAWGDKECSKLLGGSVLRATTIQPRVSVLYPHSSWAWPICNPALQWYRHFIIPCAGCQVFRSRPQCNLIGTLHHKVWTLHSIVPLTLTHVSVHIPI